MEFRNPRPSGSEDADTGAVDGEELVDAGKAADTAGIAGAREAAGTVDIAGAGTGAGIVSVAGVADTGIIVGSCPSVLVIRDRAYPISL